MNTALRVAASRVDSKFGGVGWRQVPTTQIDCRATCFNAHLYAAHSSSPRLRTIAPVGVGNRSDRRRTGYWP